MTDSYERELERVQRARADFEASQDEVERRKQDYFTSVRTLHEAGMPLREIATTLGLSHQRVHQMVEEAIGGKHARLRRKAARAAKQGGLALLIVLLGVTGFFTARPDLSPVKVPGEAPHRVSSKPPPDHDRGVPMPGIGPECALAIFDRYERTKDAAGRDVTFTIEPRCVVIEVRKRTS